MKIGTLASFTLAGMVSVGSAVYAVTPAGGFRAKATAVEASASPQPSASESAAGIGGEAAPPETKLLSEFKVGKTVELEGRMGHAAVRSGDLVETYVLLEVSPDPVASRDTRPSVSLSVVIDKSGSMKGPRLPNAVSGAIAAVDRLRDGDRVSVVAFDTGTEVVVAPTRVDGASRASIAAAIRGIKLGGDTCISCGIEEGMRQLAIARSGNGGLGAGPGTKAPDVERMVLLSDGEPTNGARLPEEFTPIAKQALAAGVGITTIGVALDYNERVMTAVALASNGGHYFVENETGIPAVFESESKILQETIASNAVAQLELRAGVELIALPDREFQRSGSHVTVPLGTIAGHGKSTVLMKVRLPRSQAGSLSVADVQLTYRDVKTQLEVTEKGSLSVVVTDDPSKVSGMDGVVLDRVQRSDTATALLDANNLFRQGKVDEAQKRLQTARQALQKTQKTATNNAPMGRASGVNNSFKDQEKSLDRAQTGFSAPAPKAAPRAAAEDAFRSTR